jgi:hypothetical protein
MAPKYKSMQNPSQNSLNLPGVNANLAEEELRGMLERVVFHNDENGYTVSV